MSLSAPGVFELFCHCRTTVNLSKVGFNRPTVSSLGLHKLRRSRDMLFIVSALWLKKKTGFRCSVPGDSDYARKSPHVPTITSEIRQAG